MKMCSENAQRVTTKGESIGMRTDAHHDLRRFQNGETITKSVIARNATG